MNDEQKQHFDKAEIATGFTRLMNASKWSFEGMQACFKTEQAFRQEVYILIVLGPLGLWLGDGAVEKILLLGSILLVMIVELLNSAIEALVDRVSTEIHPLSKVAKDTASAAVLLSLTIAVLTWGLILFL